MNNTVVTTVNTLYREGFELPNENVSNKIARIHEFSVYVYNGDLYLDEASIDKIVAQLNELLNEWVEKINLHDAFLLAKAVRLLYGNRRRKQFRELVPHLFVIFRRFAQDLHQDEDTVANLYDWIFAICWQQMTSFYDTSVAIRDSLVTPFSHFLNKKARRLDLPKTGTSEKTRICYFAQSLSVSGTYANGRAIYSLLQGHSLANSGDVDIYIYIYSDLELALAKNLLAFTNCTVRYFGGNESLTSKLERIETALKRDAVDIVISEMYGSVAVRALMRRLAPVQMYMSCGFIPLVLDEVDYFLLFDNLYEDALKYDIDPAKLLEFPYPLSRQFLDRNYSDEQVRTERAKYPNARVVFGSLCRLEKVTDEYLDTIKRLLIRIPDSILIIGGPNDQNRIKSYLAENGIQDRVFLPGTVDAHLYGKIFDIYLETFPFGQGMAVIEVMAKGVPAVKVKSPGMEAIEQKQRDQALLCENADEYIEKVERLLNDPEFFRACVEKSEQIVSYVADVEKAARQIEDYCRQVKVVCNKVA